MPFRLNSKKSGGFVSTRRRRITQASVPHRKDEAVYRKYLLTILVVLATTTSITYAQAPSGTDSSWSGNLITDFISILPKIVAAVVTGTITFIVQEYRKKKETNKLKKEKEYIVKGITEPVKVTSGQKRNSIILLGLGGTGKTTFIRSLLHDPEANPSEKTENYKIYVGTRSWENSLICNFFISDYKGQNLGTLVRAFVEQQFMPYSSMAYGHITSLILMVDLIPPKAQEDDPDHIPVDSIDDSRVQEHLKQWNDLALDAVFGLLTDSLRYVCIFINKADLMRIRGVAEKEACRARFDPLLRIVKKRSKNAKIHVVLGSAMTGEGITSIVDNLIETGVIEGQ